MSPYELAAHLDVEVPVAVRMIDIDRDQKDLQLPHSRNGKPYRNLLALVRRGGYPLGWISLPLSAEGAVLPDALAEIAESLSARSGEPVSSPVPIQANGFLLSIVVTTCASQESVVRCVEGIVSSAPGQFEVIVVENRPLRSTVEDALHERFGGDTRIRYVEEPQPGLSRARNAGLREACGDFVAFTDDDIVVDPGWAASIGEMFAKDRAVDCVTGLILPLELDTPTQLLVERFASFGKGFTPRTYSLSSPPSDQPLFPYAAGHLGSGANMAFKAEFIRDLGGFDTTLGAGTLARGGEDLDLCIRTLRAGGLLAYEPRAIVWHRHPDTPDRLRRQVFEYGVGLGAMLSKQIVVGPDRWAIISRAPRGARYFRDPDSRKNAARGATFPKSLNRLERVGVIYGPLAYLASRLKGSR